VNAWLLAAIVLLVGLCPCGLVLARAPYADALVALELAGTIGVLVLLLLAEGLERPSYFVLPLVLAPFSAAGALVFAHHLGVRE
jgi:multisubunit Na+/H+ antiporter MnhF subunit